MFYGAKAMEEGARYRPLPQSSTSSTETATGKVRTEAGRPRRTRIRRFRIRNCVIVISVFLTVQFLLAVVLMSFLSTVFPDYDPLSVLFNPFEYVQEDLEEGLSVKIPCTEVHKDAVRAIRRADTAECKGRLAEVACKNEERNLFPARLVNNCPMQEDTKARGDYVGCFRDSLKERLFVGGAVASLKKNNTKWNCIDECSRSSSYFAGLQYGVECFCGHKEPNENLLVSEKSCNMTCSGDSSEACGGYLAMKVYRTGLVPVPMQSREPAEKDTPVSVVFLLTLNGRAVRQVRRLFKRIYDVRHFYLIHVDSRQDYMFREMARLAAQFDNVKMVERRFATIWGGASLLEMHLQCLRELLQLPWQWDYVMNLSESDYPVKTLDALVEYLTHNKGQNFVKSHGGKTSKFINKQGLERTFFECDNHMWRLGTRKLPEGLHVDGGSDWVCLHERYVRYVVHGQDDTLDGLKEYFKYALLPSETFFHMTLQNSEFCPTVVNNHLHLINWDRARGCKNQHRAVVDWGGCSPHAYLMSHWSKIEATSSKDIFFVRKFEPSLSQEVLDRVDQWIHGARFNNSLPARRAYWQNIYHYLDESPEPKPEDLTVATVLATLFLETIAPIQVKLDRLEEITSYHYEDKAEGVLVLFSACDNQSALELEIMVVPRLPELNLSAGERNVQVSVGTHYDPKEALFRNLLGTIGPTSTPQLMIKVFSGSPTELIFIFLDPTDEVFYVEKKAYNSSFHLDALTPDLQKPIRPGVWKVLVVHNAVVKDQLSFLVTPLLAKYLTGDQDLFQLHSGSSPSNTESHETSHIAKISQIQTDEQTRKVLRRAADEHAWKTGASLMNWISYLVREFYTTTHGCIVNGSAETLPHCESQIWSSFHDDPKSRVDSPTF